MFIVKPSVMDTVYVYSTTQKRDAVVNPDLTVPQARVFRSLACPHVDKRPYTRIDHRAGPGCYADNYHGEVCMACGKVFGEHQVV